MAAPGSGTVFPTSYLRTEDGQPAPPARPEVLYAIFHTDCPTSELAWPYLERLRRIGEGNGLAILGVSQDGADETASFQARLGTAVGILYDPPPWRASEALRLSVVPVFARVGAGGRVREIVVGFQREKMEAFGAEARALAGRGVGPFFRPGDNVPAIRPG